MKKNPCKKHDYELCGWENPWWGNPTFKITKSNRPRLHYKCTKCNQILTRRMTDKEITHYKHKSIEEDKKIKQMHRLWHKFEKRFIRDGKWKCKGYEFMVAVDKFAAKNPEVVVTDCDDNSFCGSSIALIPHKGMGISVVIIPQYGEPCCIFLYPNHATQLVTELGRIMSVISDNEDEEVVRRVSYRFGGRVIR
jgi:hypothetical protein